MTKKIVISQLHKAEECLRAFPSSYSKKVPSRDKYGGPIFAEMHIWKDIIGEHYSEMLRQDLHNKKSIGNTETNGPYQFNTEYKVITPRMSVARPVVEIISSHNITTPKPVFKEDVL